MVDALQEDQGFPANGWTEADASLQKKFNICCFSGIAQSSVLGKG